MALLQLSFNRDLTPKRLLIGLSISIVLALAFVVVYDRNPFDRFGSRGGLGLVVYRWSDQIDEDRHASHVLFSENQWMEFDKNGRLLNSEGHEGFTLGVSPLFRRVRELRMDDQTWSARKARR